MTWSGKFRDGLPIGLEIDVELEGSSCAYMALCYRRIENFNIELAELVL